MSSYEPSNFKNNNLPLNLSNLITDYRVEYTRYRPVTAVTGVKQRRA